MYFTKTSLRLLTFLIISTKANPIITAPVIEVTHTSSQSPAKTPANDPFNLGVSNKPQTLSPFQLDISNEPFTPATEDMKTAPLTPLNLDVEKRPSTTSGETPDPKKPRLAAFDSSTDQYLEPNTQPSGLILDPIGASRSNTPKYLPTPNTSNLEAFKLDTNVNTKGINIASPDEGDSLITPASTVPTKSASSPFASPEQSTLAESVMRRDIVWPSPYLLNPPMI